LNYSNVIGLNSNDLELFSLLCENFSTYLKFNVACQKLVLTHDDLQNVFKNIASSMFSDSLKTFKFHQNYPISTRPNRYIILEIVSNTPESGTIHSDLGQSNFRPSHVRCHYTLVPTSAKVCVNTPRPKIELNIDPQDFNI